MERPLRPLSRDELLGGLSGRRGSTVLFAVQRRAAQLAFEAQHATVPAICEGMAATQERAFLSALASARRLDVVPTIQQLERFAPAWAHLVSPDPGTRADVAARLGALHRFRRHDVPAVRAALGLDEREVADAFARRGTDLDSIYTETLTARERLSWSWSRFAARLERLPPFWSTYSLTLTQTVGAGVLALPIAFAGVGPLPGVALLALLGLLNVMTAAAVAEALARTGTVRWGGAYFGRVVTGHLGRVAGVALSVMLTALAVVALVAYYVGLTTTLRAATGVPTWLWAAALFAVTLAFAVRGRVEATVVTALLVGVVNIAIVVLLSLLALPHLDAGNVTWAAVPLVGGRGFDPEIVDLVFGVVLLAFFGHTAVGNSARVVLRRDPSGRSLVHGTAAAMLTALVLYALWDVAVGGAVDPARLAAESGTALVPLAEVIGPVVLVVGSVFVVLAMGMAAVQFSIGLHHQVTELLGDGAALVRVAAVVPLAAVFVLVEWLLLTGRESFTGALSLVGTLTAPLLAGVFPVLLLTATRRRGDYVPVAGVPAMGPVVVRAAVYAVFLGAVVAHGVVIWTAPAARAAALATALVVAGVTWWVARSGAFRPGATLEVRRDRELGRVRVRLTARGARARTRLRARTMHGVHDIDLDGGADLPEETTVATVDLAPVDDVDLRVWAHEVDASGATVPLEVDVSVDEGDGGTALVLTNGRAVVGARRLGDKRTLRIQLAAHRPRTADPAVGLP